MAAEMERVHQNEEIYHPDIIFIRKKILPEEIKQELEKLKNAFEDQKTKMIDLWQSTYNVVEEGYKTNFAMFSAKLLLRNQEPEASTSDATRGKENTDASRVEFGPQTRAKSLLRNQKPEALISDANRENENVDASSIEFDPNLVETFYKMWIEQFRKNATIQKKTVLDSVKAWFELLHRLDDDDEEEEEEEEEEPQPKQSVPEYSMNKYIFNLSALVSALLSTCVLYIFQNCDFLKFHEEGHLVCFHEIIITLALKIRNFYLKFHDITLENLNVSDIGHPFKSG